MHPANNSLTQIYLALHWYLARILHGHKKPTDKDWNELSNCVSEDNPPPRNYKGGYGLCHAYSGTMVLDVDDRKKAIPYFKERSVDLDALLKDWPVQITSGRPERAKILGRRPLSVRKPLPSVAPPDGFEFRCATKAERTVR